MRGKAQTEYGSNIADRITPAYAGKSFLLFQASVTCEDHPRLCGEKLQHKVVLADI